MDLVVNKTSPLQQSEAVTFSFALEVYVIPMPDLPHPISAYT